MDKNNDFFTSLNFALLLLDKISLVRVSQNRAWR